MSPVEVFPGLFESELPPPHAVNNIQPIAIANQQTGLLVIETSKKKMSMYVRNETATGLSQSVISPFYLIHRQNIVLKNLFVSIHRLHHS